MRFCRGLHRGDESCVGIVPDDHHLRRVGWILRPCSAVGRTPFQHREKCVEYRWITGVQSTGNSHLTLRGARERIEQVVPSRVDTGTHQDSMGITAVSPARRAGERSSRRAQHLESDVERARHRRAARPVRRALLVETGAIISKRIDEAVCIPSRWALEKYFSTRDSAP